MPQDSPSRRQDQFVLRLPDGMRARIAEAAKANNRSMNAEIVSRLERSLEFPSDRSGKVPLTDEGLDEMRFFTAEAKQALRNLMNELDRAETMLLTQPDKGNAPEG